MIAQPKSVTRAHTLVLLTQPLVRWPLFSALVAILLVSGCSTHKASRSAAKTRDSKSIVSKYKTDKKDLSEAKAPANDTLADDDTESTKPMRSVRASRTQDPDRTAKAEEPKEFVDLFNRGADDKSRTAKYDAE